MNTTTLSGAVMTKDDILAKMVEILQDTFDIEPARVTPESRLYQDLDIDSIDAVDLIVRLKPLVGRRLQPEAFKSVRTVQDVVDALHGLMNDPAAA
jgi:acyl carrier protein